MAGVCMLQCGFGANFKHQERVPHSLARGRELRTNHTAKMLLHWPLIVHHKEIKRDGGERGEGEDCKSLRPPVNSSDSSYGP